MAYTQPFQTLGRIVEPGLAQQYVGKQTPAHADLAMNAPHRQRNAFLIQRRFPCEHMLVHAVDERAVEIEKKSCFVACHAPRSRPPRRRPPHRRREIAAELFDEIDRDAGMNAALTVEE